MTMSVLSLKIGAVSLGGDYSFAANSAAHESQLLINASGVLLQACGENKKHI
jgi:hypothetical protein